MTLKLKNTSKGKTSEHSSGFSATNSARKKPSRKRRLEADSESEVSEKGDDEKADVKRFRAVPKYGEFKWDLTENLAKKKNHESILVKNPVPLHPTRKMDNFLRDLIFEKRTGSLE